MQLEIYPAGGWGAAVVARLRERLAARPRLRLCLPTGETPVPVYAAVAAAVARGEVSFARAQVFLLDEFGGLPSGHAARCEQMLRRDLLDHVDLPEDHFHRPDPDVADLDAELRRYADLVTRGGLDLALVGLGANGHVGLNEPGATREAVTRRVALTPETAATAARYGGDAEGDAGPSWGVTLGIAELLGAGEVWLLVTGAHKARILQRTLEGPVDPEAPATLLRDHPRALVLADEPAAALLAGSPSQA